MRKNGFAQNSIWIISGQVVKLAISFVVSVLTTRYLGPSNFGAISYVQSYVTLITAFVALGLNGVIIYELVNHKGEDGKILGTAITLRFVLGVLCTAFFLTLFSVIESGNEIMLKIAILQSIQIPFLCLDTIQYWFQWQLKSKYPVIIQTVAHLITSVYKVFLLIVGKSVEWFAFALSLDIILLSVLYLVLYQKKKTTKLRFSAEIAKRIGTACLPFTLASIMTVIYGQMDKVMVQLILRDEKQVGLYSVAITICTLIAFIPNAILESARPLVMEAKQCNQELYKKRYKQLIAAIFWICLVYSMFVCLLSKIVLYVLYGEAYLGANITLKIAVWYTAFAFIGSAKSIWLICEKKNKYVFVFSTMGAVTNLILNYLLIPYIGINGAALATLVTECLVNFVYPIIFRDTREYSKVVAEAIIFKGIDINSVYKPLLNKIKNRR